MSDSLNVQLSGATLARNLLPALVPLLVAVAIGVTLGGARRAGLLVGAALVAYSLGFSALASLSPALQRPDWQAVDIDELAVSGIAERARIMGSVPVIQSSAGQGTRIEMKLPYKAQ